MAFFNIFKKKKLITLVPVDQLPKFKYHPDPIKTGSIERSKNICESCGRKTGYVYTGTVFSEKELEEGICPWCIADGSAHKKFSATFNNCDWYPVPNKVWKGIKPEIIEEVENRTPGFSSWQGERWWAHCDDAAEFLGHAGKKEIKQFGNELIDYLKKEYITSRGDIKEARKRAIEYLKKTKQPSKLLKSGSLDEQWNDFFDNMEKDGSPTAYVFKCRKCGKLGGYYDSH